MRVDWNAVDLGVIDREDRQRERGLWEGGWDVVMGGGIRIRGREWASCGASVPLGEESGLGVGGSTVVCWNIQQIIRGISKQKWQWYHTKTVNKELSWALLANEIHIINK